MERKPWPIVLLALFHVLEPLCKLVFYSYYWNISTARYFTYLQHQSTPMELFLFLGAFPLAGIAIFAVKSWSLPVFLGIQIMTLSTHIYHHAIAPQTFPLSLVVGMSIMNLAVVTYFLLPAVRIAYLDASIRWWEAMPRFVVEWKGTLNQGSAHQEVLVQNISEGGVFLNIRGKNHVSFEKPVRIKFDLLTTPLDLAGIVRHQSTSGDSMHAGLQFCDLHKADKKKIRQGIKSLEKLGYKQNRIQDEAFASFRKWAVRLLKTGKGLLPDSARRRAAKPPTDNHSKIKK
ncbi:PilZ domain-containing protein, partial [bacterium]|nr:PilZ domain-containing protein [bacterium]